MRDTTIYGSALIIGALGMLVTMVLHPTGPEIRSAGTNAAHAIEVAVYVHALAISTLPVGFFGFMGLSRQLGGNGVATQFPLILYGFSSLTGMCAGVFSGFGATQVVKQILKTDEPNANQFLQLIYQYNGTMNQGFAKVMFVSLAFAIVIWSVRLLQANGMGKAIGAAGIILGSSSLLAFVFGLLRLDVYGLGLFVLANSIWTLALAAWLIRSAQLNSSNSVFQK